MEKCSGVSILSADTRRRIIEQLALNLSYRQLANSLGVSPAAIYKYLSGKSTPRDEVICRALALAGDLGLTEIGELILEDLARELEGLLDKLIEYELASSEHIARLADVVGRAKLVLAASLRAHSR